MHTTRLIAAPSKPLSVSTQGWPSFEIIVNLARSQALQCVNVVVLIRHSSLLYQSARMSFKPWLRSCSIFFSNSLIFSASKSNLSSTMPKSRLISFSKLSTL